MLESTSWTSSRVCSLFSGLLSVYFKGFVGGGATGGSVRGFGVQVSNFDLGS